MNPKNLKTNYRHKTKTSIHHWSLQPTKGSSEREEKKPPKTQNQKPKKKKTKRNKTQKEKTGAPAAAQKQPASHQPARTRAAARGFENQRKSANVGKIDRSLQTQYSKTVFPQKQTHQNPKIPKHQDKKTPERATTKEEEER
jgi:hypothetical protein